MKYTPIPPKGASTSSLAVEPTSEAEHSVQHIKRVAERAHYKAEHRTGSDPANADQNWLEAEREIDSATKGDQR